MTGPDQPDQPLDRDEPAGAGRTPLSRAQARDELLARLAAQVRTTQTATDRRIDALETTTAASTDLLAQALPRIDTALDQLATLTAQLEQQPAAQVAPVCWPTLTAAEASTVWAQLADWIDRVLVGWYGLTRAQLPDCWALHRTVVLELTWLHTTYREAHTPGARAGLAADWHTRWRPAALAAIAAATDTGPGSLTSGCRPGHHHDPAGPLPADAYRPPPDQPVDGRHVSGREKLPARREFWHTNYLTAVHLDRDDRARRTPPGLA